MNTDRLARPLHTFERRGETRTFDVDGWTLLRDFPTVLFGDGGSMKSFLALYLAGRLAQQGTRVLLLDWELDGEDHRERLHRLFGSDVPAHVYYLRAEGPLVTEANAVAREVQRHGIQYLVCDSVGMATVGAPDTSDAAVSYFRALRQLGVRGSLGIAHVTKAGDASDQRPFGSVYWHHLARMTWFVKREASAPERPRVRLVNRKTNLTPILPDIRLQFDFSESRIVVSPYTADAEAAEPLDTEMSIPQRIITLLRASKQPMTVAAIAEALNAKPDTVARVIRRNKSFVKLPMVDGRLRFGLAERRVE